MVMRRLLPLSLRKSLRKRNLPPPRRSLLPPKNKPSPLLPPKMRDRLPLRVRLTSATIVTPTAEVVVTTEVTTAVTTEVMVVEAAVDAATEAETEEVVVATVDPAKMLTASSPRVTPRTSPVETTTIGVEVETAVTTVATAVEAVVDVEAVVEATEEATGEEEDLKLPTERAVPPKIMEGTRLRTTDNSSEGIRLNMRMQMLYLISRGRLSILEDD